VCLLLLLLLLQMNVRSLCVSRVARDVGEPWLWWEYVDRMGDDCSMQERKFDTDCSEKVGACWGRRPAGGRPPLRGVRQNPTSCVSRQGVTCILPGPLVGARVSARVASTWWQGRGR
jgi:hypothetical protein